MSSFNANCNQTEEVNIEAFKQNVNCNQTEEVNIEAFKQNGLAIQYIITFVYGSC